MKLIITLMCFFLMIQNVKAQEVNELKPELTVEKEAQDAVQKKMLNNVATTSLQDDTSKYCQYISNKQQAKYISLVSPDVVVHIDNDNTNEDEQSVVFGLSKDLADFGRAKHVKQLALDECESYKVNQEAELQVRYAIALIENKAASHKLYLSQQAKAKVKDILNLVQKRVDTQNESLPGLYEVELTLHKLEDTERQLKSTLASVQLPNVNNSELNELLKATWLAEKNKQSTLNALEKKNNWSVQLQAGVKQTLVGNNLNNLNNSSSKPYFLVAARYNLGAIVANKYLDESLDNYLDWKNAQVTGPQHNLSKLIVSVVSLKKSEEDRLMGLVRFNNRYNSVIHELEQYDSPEAIRFKQKLDINQIMADIEIEYITYKVSLLKKMLDDANIF